MSPKYFSDFDDIVGISLFADRGNSVDDSKFDLEPLKESVLAFFD
jgi:hypothetical protein